MSIDVADRGQPRSQRFSPWWVAAGAGLCLVALFAPIVAVIAAVILLGASHKRRELVVPVLAGSYIVATFAVSNATKTPASDWLWYTAHYRILEYTPLGEYFASEIDYIRPKSTEPVFYLLARALAVLTGSSVVALAVAVTILIYTPVIAAALAGALTETRRASVLTLATVVAVVGGVTFTLSTQLVRQEIASSFVALGAVLLARDRRTAALLLLGLAALTHNSAVIPVAVVVAAAVAARLPWRWVSGAAIFGGFTLLGLYYIRSGGEQRYSGASDGEIATVVIVLDLAITIGFVALCHRAGWTRLSRLIGFAVPGMYGFLLGVSSQPLPLLRMYFYMEVFRSLMLAISVAIALRGSRVLGVWGALVLGVSATYLVLRVQSSPFEYGMTPWDVLLISPFR